MSMKYDSPVAMAALAEVNGIIVRLGDAYEAEGDMDGYWACINIIGDLNREMGDHLSRANLTGDQIDRVRAALRAAKPPRR